MSLYPIMEAHRQGFDENMYLDPATRTKVEETGGANFIFVLQKDEKLKYLKLTVSFHLSLVVL